MTSEKLFVYGIFLDEDNRRRYHMSNPHYATVRDFVTYGDTIVVAYKQQGAGLALTGLLVDVEPTYAQQSLRDDQPTGTIVDNWGRLDALEYGYDRIRIITTDGDDAWMYVAEGTTLIQENKNER